MKIGTSYTEFDAELNTDVCDAYNNADLTITLRIGFKQVNPAAGAAEGTYNDYGDATEPTRKIIKWTPGSWNLWKTNFVSSAQKYWHGKFWLINSSNAMEFEEKGVKYSPNVWCRFRLIGSNAGSGTHNHIIDVVRLHRSENWFGSHSTLYDSLDTTSVEKSTDSAGNPIMQQAHVHEVGHLLGLGHVDEGKGLATCLPANTNARGCYGVADIDKNSVMGSGMQLRAKQANPWRRAIVDLTGKGYGASDWAAKMKRHYPRTAAEVAANRAIISRPVR